MISDHLASVKQNIQEICQKVGRNDEITLIGVSKYATVEQTKEAIEAGVAHLGENRVHEAADKFEKLGSLTEKVTKHMIGHLQTNKVKRALEIFDVIQSVDSVKLAKEIEKQAAGLDRQVDILVQLNISGEAQRSGIDPDEVEELLVLMQNLKHLNVNGLMAMAPHTDDKDLIRDCFRRLRQMKERMAEKFCDVPNIDLKILSMGMTADYDIAIEEGSNMVRIGSAIFK